MHNFKFKPNVGLLRQYLQTDESRIPEFMFSSEIFNHQEAEEIKHKLKALLNKFRIDAHYDNLLYLIITKHEEIQNQYAIIHQSYDSKLRAKELASLLLLLQNFRTGKLISITAKTNFDTATIKDPVLVEWIAKLVVQTVEEKNFPIGAFGESVIREIFGTSNPILPEPIDPARLKAAQEMKVAKPSKAINLLLAEFCLFILPYLQTETTLRAKEGAMFSDAQLNFFFELLTILNLLGSEGIDSEPKDYMRSIFNNYKTT